MQSPFTSSSASATPPAAKDASLGALVSEHPSDVKTFFIVGGFLVASGLGLLAYYKFTADFFWVICSVVVIPLGVGSVIWGATKLGQDAKRYENGISITQKGQTAALRWEEITSIVQKITRVYHNGVHTGTTHVYWITGKDGRTWKIDDAFRDVEVIGDQVQTEVAKRQLPLLLQDFKAGRPVKFGDLVFDSNGITNGKTLIPWVDFKSVDFKNGHLRVHKPKDGMRGLLKGGSLVINVSELPNLYALIGFLENLPVYERGLE